MDYKKSVSVELTAVTQINLSELEGFVINLYNNSTAGRIITSGMGKAGLIANFLSTTLCSVGCSASFIHPSEAQHGDLGIIRDFDTILCFTNSGKTRELIELIGLARKWKPHIRIFSVIGTPSSEIENLSDATFIFGPVEEICSMKLVPTTSTTCMSVICDLIAAHFTELAGTTPEIYNKLHHAGYLGIKSSKL